MSKLGVIVAITIFAVLPAQLGFAKLVATVYPIVGYIGLPILAQSSYSFSRHEYAFINIAYFKIL